MISDEDLSLKIWFRKISKYTKDFSSCNDYVSFFSLFKGDANLCCRIRFMEFHKFDHVLITLGSSCWIPFVELSFQKLDMFNFLDLPKKRRQISFFNMYQNFLLATPPDMKFKLEELDQNRRAIHYQMSN